MKKDDNISRSHRFSLHFQLLDVRESLVEIAVSGVPITEISRDVVRKLRHDTLQLVKGKTIESIPEISDSATLPDLLLVVSLLTGTSKSFLTEDEVETLSKRAAVIIGGVAKAREAFGI